MYKAYILAPIWGYTHMETVPGRNLSLALQNVMFSAALKNVRRRGRGKVNWLKNMIWSLVRRGAVI